MQGKNITGWVVVALVSVATLLNYVDRQTLALLAHPIQAELKMDDKGYAFVITAFMFAYMAGNFTSGWIVDRMGPRVSLGIFVAWWSIASAASGMVFSMHQLAACRLALGLAEVGNFIAAPALVTLFLPKRDRALGVGIYTAAAMFGATISPPLVTWINQISGWRLSFICFGIIGLVWAAAWLMYSRHLKPSDTVDDDASESGPLGSSLVDLISLRQTLLTPKVWGIAFGAMLTYPVWYFYLNWFPKYLTDERGMSLTEMGSKAWIVYAAAGVGSLIGGGLSGLLIQNRVSPKRAKLYVMGLVCVLAPVGAINYFAPPIYFSLAAAAAVGFLQMFWQVNLTALPSDMFTKRSLGKVYATAGMTSGLMGMATTWGIGQLVGQFSYRPMFLIMGLAYPLAISVVLLLINFKGTKVASEIKGSETETRDTKINGVGAFIGRVAVVTGGSSGIGQAIVAELRRHGAKVLILDIRAGSDEDVFVCDLSDDGAVAAAAQSIKTQFGAPSIVIHCAATSVTGTLTATSSTDFARIFSVNSIGAIRLAKAFSPDMIAKKDGVFLFISSINARFATPNLGAYAASKAALDSLAKTLALELASSGIRVNTIRPASIDTPLLRSGYMSMPNPKPAMLANIARHPLGRWGTPNDIAKLAVFLVSDDASWITGAHYDVDGGAGITRK